MTAGAHSRARQVEHLALEAHGDQGWEARLEEHEAGSARAARRVPGPAEPSSERQRVGAFCSRAGETARTAGLWPFHPQTPATIRWARPSSVQEHSSVGRTTRDDGHKRSSGLAPRQVRLAGIRSKLDTSGEHRALHEDLLRQEWDSRRRGALAGWAGPRVGGGPLSTSARWLPVLSPSLVRCRLPGCRVQTTSVPRKPGGLVSEMAEGSRLGPWGFPDFFFWAAPLRTLQGQKHCLLC